MHRRAFLAGTGAVLLTAPLVAQAQPAGRATRIGFLSPSSLHDPRTQTFVEAFRQGLRDLGWVEGQNMTIEYRWAEERTERLPDLARDLARLKVDVVVASTSPAVQAAGSRSFVQWGALPGHPRPGYLPLRVGRRQTVRIISPAASA